MLAGRRQGQAIPPRRREDGRGDCQAARPAGRIREDRRRAEPGARQPRRQHAGQAAQGRLAAAIPRRRPDRRPGRRRVRRRASGRAKRQATDLFDELADQEAKGSQNVSQHHGRHAGLFRAAPLRPVQDRARRHARAGRRSAACGNWATTCRRRTACRSPSANSGPTRSTAGPKTWSIPPRAAPDRAANRSGSLPPSIVLEVLQILEAEVNLREETRVAEQARPASTPRNNTPSRPASSPKTQDEPARAHRQGHAADPRACPTARASSPRRSGCSARSSQVMDEATEILAGRKPVSRPSRAETEAIELLLQSKRINPKRRRRRRLEPRRRRRRHDHRFGPGLVGTRRQREGSARGPRRSPRPPATAAPTLPEEFRSGLDEYFNRAGQECQAVREFFS